MEQSVLVAAQVSSLFPSTHALSVVVQTTRSRLNATPQSSSDSEHAIYAEIFNTDVTGTILLRVIHEGHILELISLSTNAPPIRFIFSDPVIPNPAVMVNLDQDIHIIAVTSSGSLFRIVLPIPDSAPLWQATSLSYISIREYLINKWKPDTRGILAHVQSVYSVVLASADGSILRLEIEQLSQDGQDGASRLRLGILHLLTFNCNRSVVRAAVTPRFFFQLSHFVTSSFGSRRVHDHLCCIAPSTDGLRPPLDFVSRSNSSSLDPAGRLCF